MTKRDELNASLASVRCMLDMIPAEQVIDRATFESHARGIEEQLAQLRDEPEAPLLNIYFDGGPVIGSEGIEVGFAADALRAITHAVQARARDLRGNLRPDGSLGRPELFVTDRMAGSVGFRLQAIRPGLDGETRLELHEALDSVSGLIEGSLRGDEELAEAASSAPPRVVNLVLRFFNRCTKAQAIFRLSTANREVRPESVTVIAAAANRLRDVRTEEEVKLVGQLTGICLHDRTFEFEEPGGVVTKGKVSRDLTGYDMRKLGLKLFQACEVHVRVTRVGSSSRGVRHLLLRAAFPGEGGG